jgi:hypothetical protein
MKNKICNLEKGLKNKNSIPTNGNNVVKTPIDTDSLVLGICKNQLGIKLNLTGIGRSYPNWRNP